MYNVYAKNMSIFLFEKKINNGLINTHKSMDVNFLLTQQKIFCLLIKVFPKFEKRIQNPRSVFKFVGTYLNKFLSVNYFDL